ncbi:MAG: hypothetical protein H6573_05985 [Lewinellaceae bacterium]|nr:hypothetical protein [Phaeodactylibacter sp.]MCB9347053.1 hypothetical protein [Lewinellaceae bacterium]
MKTHKKVFLLSLLLIFVLNLSAQEADTTSLGYQVGYHIGNWLPFSIIVLLTLLVLLKSSRQKRDS